MDKGSSTWLWRLIIVAAVIVIGFFDWLTGYELDFLLFYFLPITLGGWFLEFGELLTLAFVCTAVWAGADVLSGHEYSSYFFLVWNSLIRLVAFLAIGGAVHKIRYLLEHEREITKALHEAHDELEERVRERTPILWNPLTGAGMKEGFAIIALTKNLSPSPKAFISILLSTRYEPGCNRHLL